MRLGRHLIVQIRLMKPKMPPPRDAATVIKLGIKERIALIGLIGRNLKLMALMV